MFLTTATYIQRQFAAEYKIIDYYKCLIPSHLVKLVLLALYSWISDIQAFYSLYNGRGTVLWEPKVSNSAN